MKLLLLILTMASLLGCSWYLKQYAQDNPCLSVCAQKLKRSESEVLATRGDSGYCVCEAINHSFHYDLSNELNDLGG